MSLDKELDQLHLLMDKDFLNDEDIEILRYLSFHKNDEVRCNVAKALINADTEKAEQILLLLLDDKSYLVRADACDSLCFNSNPQVLVLLKKIVAKDRVGLVRSYAVMSIGDIALTINSDKQKLLLFLEQRLLVEKCKHTKISFFRTMYILGAEKYLRCLIEQLKNVRYQHRCATINALREVVTNENKSEIVEAFKELQKTEKTAAVKSSIERVLGEITQ